MSDINQEQIAILSQKLSEFAPPMSHWFFLVILIW